jgi:hypothetical protein
MRSLFFVLLIFLSFNTSKILAKSTIGLSESFTAKKKKEGGFDKNKLFVGGGLGAGGFGNGFFAAVSPLIGYRFTDKLHAGASIGINYFRSVNPYNNILNGSPEKYIESGIHYNTNIFARYFVLPVAFIQIQPEYNNFKAFNFPIENQSTGQLEPDSYRFGIPSFLVGAGYAQQMGNGSYLMFSIMYDLVQNPNSPYYRRPIFGGGLALGLFGGQ